MLQALLRGVEGKRKLQQDRLTAPVVNENGTV